MPPTGSAGTHPHKHCESVPCAAHPVTGHRICINNHVAQVASSPGRLAGTSTSRGLVPRTSFHPYRRMLTCLPSFLPWKGFFLTHRVGSAPSSATTSGSSQTIRSRHAHAIECKVLSCFDIHKHRPPSSMPSSPMPSTSGDSTTTHSTRLRYPSPPPPDSGHPPAEQRPSILQRLAQANTLDCSRHRSRLQGPLSLRQPWNVSPHSQVSKVSVPCRGRHDHRGQSTNWGARRL